MSRTIQSLACLLLLSSCGPSVIIEPLIGDDPAVLAHVQTTRPDLSGFPPASTARALYDALQAQDLEASWSLLSAETQRAFDAHAVEHDLAPSGKALLARSFSQGLPLMGPEGVLMRVRPDSWLLTENLAHFRIKLDGPGDPPGETERVKLYAIDTEERFREVLLVRQDDGYRVHKPVLVTGGN